MKSTIIEQPKEVKPEYPCLKICVRFNIVVLFEEKGAGTVVNQGTSRWAVGHYSSCWDAEEYTPFNNKIELSNS